MIKIVLLCNAGMSTSLLMNKMREAALVYGFECTVEAHGVATAKDTACDADVILLGPQIRFNLNKIKEIFPTKLIEAIETTAYGTMNGKSVIEHVMRMVSTNG